ncbi:MAG: 50S ribosomal protein L9 [Hyphomicrobiaceae bacterium]|nr:50S ribosomal protein L9 [Hyphomicrobiaceae bacterium]
MKVILLQRIKRLGQMGDEVVVKPGYARNHLLPSGKALRANKANRAYFETQRAQLEATNLEHKKEADAVAEKINGKNFVAIRQAGDTGQLYGSVATKDITDVITDNGFTIARNQVMLDRPIKLLGLHEVRLSLHPEVDVTVTINVARTQEEAERQERGEDISAVDDGEDEEEAIDAEDVFDDGELAEQAEAELSDEEGGEEADSK